MAGLGAAVSPPGVSLADQEFKVPLRYGVLAKVRRVEKDCDAMLRVSAWKFAESAWFTDASV